MSVSGSSTAHLADTLNRGQLPCGRATPCWPACWNENTNGKTARSR